MAATCPTTEAALQAGLLPAQERRKGCFAKALAFAKPEICRTRVGGCPAQSSALLGFHFSENDKHPIKSNIWFFIFCFSYFDGGYLPDNWSCASGWAPACAGATERVFCKGLGLNKTTKSPQATSASAKMPHNPRLCCKPANQIADFISSWFLKA